jgi:hypothetical protein
LIPGLATYIDGELHGYASVVLAPPYPHPCLSFSQPARSSVSLRRSPTTALLFVVLRGRSKPEDVNWRVVVNGVKVSRVFKPQHVANLGDFYYVYVADVTPVLSNTTYVDLYVGCHAYETYVEAVGIAGVYPEDFRSRVRVYAGLSRVASESSVDLGWGDFHVVGLVGSGRGEVLLGSERAEANRVFELNHLTQSSRLTVRGSLSIYVVAVNSFSGRPPELLLEARRVEGGRVRLAVVNPSSYAVRGAELRIQRGGSTVHRVTLGDVGPGRVVELDVELPHTNGASAKLTYEFCGISFVRTVPIAP